MEKTKVLLGIVVAVVLMFGVTSSATADLLNGDLETDAHTNGTTDGTPDGKPDNWTFNSWDSGWRTTGTWDTSTYKSATHSYKIEQNPSYPNGGSGMFYADRFAVDASTQYTFKCWVKIEKTTYPTQIEIYFYKANGDSAGSRKVFDWGDTNDEWLEKTHLVTTYSETAKVKLQFVAYKFDNGTTNDAKFYIDDVSFTPEPATMTLLLLGLPFALRRRR